MRILILNVDYPGFLSSLYKQNQDLATAPYEHQVRARVNSLFGVADFYSRNLSALGHVAWDLHINNEIMQTAWAREHAIKADTLLPHRGVKVMFEKMRRVGNSPLVKQLKPWFQPLTGGLNGQRGLLAILAAQIRHYKPDVILNQAVQWIPDGFLRDFKPKVKLIVGQIASPLSADKRLSDYDLMISSLPNFVDYFRKQGLNADLVRLAFEHTILDELPDQKRSIDVSFVGTLSADHRNRLDLLEGVARNLNLEVWGRLDSALPAGSTLGLCHHGSSWGREMYSLLQKSRITLNYHIGIAKQHANNLRLFEATGVGTLLLTDQKQDLHEIFEPGKEVAVYRTPAECIDIGRYYLEHEHEREVIAHAGQQRTLRDHTYQLRMQELAMLVERCLKESVSVTT